MQEINCGDIKNRLKKKKNALIECQIKILTDIGCLIAFSPL